MASRGFFSSCVQWVKEKLGFEEAPTRFDDSESAQRALPLQMKGISTHMNPSSSENDGLQVYKLPLHPVRQDETEMIAKYYVDKAAPPRTVGVSERVLMVVGATGAGKSTLINGISNYLLGVNWSHNFRFKLITDEKSGSQANSQTKWITAYTFPRKNGSPVHYNLTVIDTPGFGDTEGLERDKRIAAQIKKFFEMKTREGGMDTIHGIGFVCKAPESRLTPTQKYIFNAILKNFGVDIGDNIFLLVTFADGQRPPVLDAIKQAEIPVQPAVFKFNNSALYAASQRTTSEDGEEDFDAMFWRMGMKSFKDFFKHFEAAEAKSLQLTREVLQEREQLEILIQDLQKQVRAGMNKMNSLRTEMEILRQHRDAIEANKDFEYEVEEERMKRIQMTGEDRWFVTNCLSCNYTCHERCIYAKDEDKRRCSAIDRSTGNCKVCPRNCNWRTHVNNDFYYEIHTVKVVKTYREMLSKYKDAQGKMSQSAAVVGGIERELQHLRKRVFTMIIQLHQSLERLEEIALKPDPLTQVAYIDLLIESEKQQATKDWQKRVEYYQEARQQAVLIGNFTGRETVSNPQLEDLLDVGSVKLLISAEKKHKKNGWEIRVQHYERIEKRLKGDPQQGISTCRTQ